jgi:ribonuclease T2
LPLALLALSAPALAQQHTQYVLAISWQPAFCETAPSRTECRTQTRDRFDAANFVLHGLWPQRMDYCRLPDTPALRDDDPWRTLPAPTLAENTRKTLEQAMPGSQSYLDRHQWVKHGSCYGTDADTYFQHALFMLEAINASAVRDLFAENIGRRLTQKQIRAAFDTAFGRGAGQRVRISCEQDGNRYLITELTIGLTGAIRSPRDLPRLLQAARPTGGGCDAGIVDPVGLQ